MQPTRFLIHSKHYENNTAHIQIVRSALEEHGFIYDEKNPSLIIILGGDGSFLRAVHSSFLPRGKQIKYVLFNTGHLGFYSDYSKDELDAFVNDLIHTEPETEYLPFYRCTIDGYSHHFINDIALQSGFTVFMNVYVENELLTTTRCNGIVVGTPAGSSGFLSSLGAPMIINGPDIYQFHILAACRNRLFTNPITQAVISGKQELKLEIDNSKSLEIYIDGVAKRGYKGHVFTFSHKSNEYISLYHFRKLSYVARLRKNISGKEN